MNKEVFNQLKMKFTDGNGKYIFPVPVEKMNKDDLKEYIDYLEEKASKATYYANLTGSIKAQANEFNCVQKLIHTLNFIRVNRPDFQLTFRQKELSLFKGGLAIG